VAIAGVVAAGLSAPAEAARADDVASRGHEGTLDRSFDRDGLVTTDLGGDVDWGEYASDVAVAPDGRIVAGGPVQRMVAGQATMEWALVRYHRNGALDRGFGDGGRVTTRFGGGWDFLSSVVVQPDGKIVAAGFAAEAPGGGGADFALARYGRDGRLDPTFGTGGRVTTDFDDWGSGVRGLALTSDGRLVAVGQRDDGFTSDLALARYDRDGRLDPTFGTGGQVSTDFAGGFDTADAVVALDDGRLVVAGAADDRSGDLDFGLARYRPDGTLDPAFGNGGLVVTDVAGDGAGQLTSLARAPGGRLVAAGYAIVDGALHMALAHYAPAGTLDPGFAGDGLVTINPSSGDGSTASDVAVQADGKPVMVGTAFGPPGIGGFAVVRFRRDGRLDNSFGASGTVVTDFGAGGAGADALAIEPDGRLLVAGSVFPAGAVQADVAVARFHANPRPGH
jgi:uncharacterized delta-60 repeat protein